MSETLEHVLALIRLGKVSVSEHAYDELEADGLFGREVIAGVYDAVVVEDYPTFAKGPCVLVRQKDAKGLLIHALWGVRSGTSEPAVLITVYRPDPKLWEAGFLRRR